MAKASKTSNAGHTRRINNLFRKRVIEFEKGVLEAKLDSIPRDKWEEISEELYDIEDKRRIQ
jgi:hypothetical protein